MPKENGQNPMPQVGSQTARKILAWASWMLLLAMPSLTALAALLPEGNGKLITIILLGLFGTFAVAIKTGLVNPLKVGPTVVALIFFGASSAGCVSAAVKTTHGAMTLTQLTGKTLADVHKIKGDKMCVHIKRWKAGARPGMRIAIAGAVAAIKAGGNVLEALKPGLCEVFRFFEAAKHELGDKGKIIAEQLKPFSGLVCVKSKGAVQILTVILPIAQAIIKWLMDKLGSKDSDLLKEISTWLKAPPNDPTDALCLSTSTS
jgi:hypothetical protein